MWLRSEKRSNRVSRGDAAKSTINLRKIIKSTPNIKALKGKCKASPPATAALSSSRRQQQHHLQQNSAITEPPKSQAKCNKIKASVKRLGRRPNTGRKCDKIKTNKAQPTTTSATALHGRNVRRKLSDPGKENCWQDNNQQEEEITLYTTNVVNVVKGQTTADVEINRNCSSIDGLANDEALNNFGPIVVDCHVTNATNPNANPDGPSSCKGSCVACRTINIAAAICQIDKEISECDSTTDYEKIGASEMVASTSTSSSSSTSMANTSTYFFKPLQEVVVPEVDSTTDLFPSVSTTNPVTIDEDELSQRGELPKLTIPPLNANLTYHPFSMADCNRTSPDDLAAAGSSSGLCTGTASNTNYPSTPDLISLFDEEINKGSSDLCQYSDFFPYNNVITQALLSCNEVNALCEQTDLTANLQPSDITFLSSMNQTAIDNLKALTNLQNHTTNFLSGITLPKASCSNASNNNTDALIHSVAAASNVAAMTMYPHHQQMMMQPQDPAGMVQQHEIVDDTADIQLETDECMESEEIHERQEELTWEFDPYLFIKHLPPLTPEMRAKCPALPLKTRSSPEFNLVLDLDETLVHCSLQELSDASFKFPVLFQVRFAFLLIITFFM